MRYNAYFILETAEGPQQIESAANPIEAPGIAALMLIMAQSMPVDHEDLRCTGLRIEELVDDGGNGEKATGLRILGVDGLPREPTDGRVRP